MNPYLDPFCAFFLTFAIGMAIIACVVVWNVLRFVGIIVVELADHFFCKLMGMEDEDDDLVGLAEALTAQTGHDYQELLNSIDTDTQAGRDLMRVLRSASPT